MLDGASGAGERRPDLAGDLQRVGATILGVALAPYVVRGLEAVDQRDHRGAINAHALSELVLGDRPFVGEAR